MTDLERINTITVLELEVEVLESKVQPHATGYIITAIGVLKSRIDELRKEEMKEKYGRAVETIHVGLEELG
jgi:FtsZ-binding cell division protein ZapB